MLLALVPVSALIIIRERPSRGPWALATAILVAGLASNWALVGEGLGDGEDNSDENADYGYD